MDEILELLKTANSMTPLGVIGLLGTIIWMLVKTQKVVVSKMDVISDNHLHELPDLVENSRRSVDVLQRIEVKLGENFAVINHKLDGLDKK